MEESKEKDIESFKLTNEQAYARGYWWIIACQSNEQEPFMPMCDCRKGENSIKFATRQKALDYARARGWDKSPTFLNKEIFSVTLNDSSTWAAEDTRETFEENRRLHERNRILEKKYRWLCRALQPVLDVNLLTENWNDVAWNSSRDGRFCTHSTLGVCDYKENAIHNESIASALDAVAECQFLLSVFRAPKEFEVICSADVADGEEGLC